MGFRTGAYATVWDVLPKSDKVTQIRISTSKKPRGSDEYVQDFSGYCSCVGAELAKKASLLKKGDRIKLGDIDVNTTYESQTKKVYTNYTIFSFEKPGEEKVEESYDPVVTSVEDGDPDEGIPF